MIVVHDHVENHMLQMQFGIFFCNGNSSSIVFAFVLSTGIVKYIEQTVLFIVVDLIAYKCQKMQLLPSGDKTLRPLAKKHEFLFRSL